METWRLGPGFFTSKGRGGNHGSKAAVASRHMAASFSPESVPRISAASASSGRNGYGGGQSLNWSNFEDVVNDILPFRLVEQQDQEVPPKTRGASTALPLRGDYKPFVKLVTLTAIAFSTIFIFYETRFLRAGLFTEIRDGENPTDDYHSLPTFLVHGKQSRSLNSVISSHEENIPKTRNNHFVSEINRRRTMDLSNADNEEEDKESGRTTGLTGDGLSSRRVSLEEYSTGFPAGVQFSDDGESSELEGEAQPITMESSFGEASIEQRQPLRNRRVGPFWAVSDEWKEAESGEVLPGEWLVAACVKNMVLYVRELAAGLRRHTRLAAVSNDLSTRQL